jgi:hypothetical protein
MDESMSEQPAKDSRGIQAYRWWMAVGVAATATLAGLILTTVKETATDVSTLKAGFASLTTTQIHQGARLDAIDRRNDQQDQKIEGLQQRVYQMGANSPRVPQSEEQQRMQWQRQ